MKKLLFPILILLVYSMSFAQTPEEMKAWQDNMTPGEHHKWLANFDGDWIGSTKMWMDPETPPMTNTMETKNEMVMNGLYQRSTHSGDMMGMPFKGEGLVGYDNAKKVFVTTWFDNMGSGITHMEGQRLDDSNVLETRGFMTDAMSGKQMELRQVLRYIDENSHVFEMYMTVDGQEMKTMEITYTRKQ